MRGSLTGLRRRLTRQGGNTLVLFPAAILIVFGLGAIAVESANLFLATRRLADIASTVANDGANTILASGFYEEGGAATPDRGAAEDRLAATVAAQGGAEVGLADLDCGFTEFSPGDAAAVDPQVTVACSARIDAIFGGVWAGGRERVVTVSESARSVSSG
ncbi:MAG: hypothetical protein JJT89_02075 [Nitriliruptoraceae bacterium]|nr:hypothetical protein [Nitriliruptoraceae bacterium]